jgi:hypothetical protein
MPLGLLSCPLSAKELAARHGGKTSWDAMLAHSAVWSSQREPSIRIAERTDTNDHATDNNSARGKEGNA